MTLEDLKWIRDAAATIAAAGVSNEILVQKLPPAGMAANAMSTAEEIWKRYHQRRAEIDPEYAQRVVDELVSVPDFVEEAKDKPQLILTRPVT